MLIDYAVKTQANFFFFIISRTLYYIAKGKFGCIIDIPNSIPIFNNYTIFSVSDFYTPSP